MSEFQYKAGLNHVGSYQVSGIPYATASLTVPGSASAPLEIVFPSVTQRIMIMNQHASNPLRVGFSVNGVKDGNYVYVEPHDPNGKNIDKVELRIKTDRIFLLSGNSSALTSSVYVNAELTGIQLGFNLAAAYSGSAGIG